jgi:hypothetical protein
LLKFLENIEDLKLRRSLAVALGLDERRPPASERARSRAYLWKGLSVG